MLKRCFCFFLTLVMVLGMLPLAALAEQPDQEDLELMVAEESETRAPETTEPVTEPETTETSPPETREEPVPETTEETIPDPTEETVPETTEEEAPEDRVHIAVETEILGTPEERYEGYVQSVMYGQETAACGAAAGDALTGDALTLYKGMIPFLKEIADGDRASSIIAFGENGADIALAPDCLDYTGVREVWKALLQDYPYDTYWWTGGGWFIADAETGNMRMLLSISSLYHNGVSTDGYYVTADTKETGRARQAERNARAVVKQYAGYDDYEKLAAYALWIAENVDYDYYAYQYGPEIAGYGAWTTVNVFDGDVYTNVVCDGYAKAFQYLCDMSTFKDVKSYYVIGTTSDLHAWNIVELEGERYLVDLTAYDSIIGDYEDEFLLAGVAPDEKGWYPIGTWSYLHDKESLIKAFGTTELNLSTSYYVWKRFPNTPHMVKITKDGTVVTGQTIQVQAGRPFQLEAAVYPTTASREIYWSSSYEWCTTISDTGLVMPYKVGMATIYASLSEVPGEGLYTWVTLEIKGTSLGEDLTWSVSDGVLRIEGTGTMMLDIEPEYVPWADQAGSITELVLPGSLRDVYCEAFNALPNLTKVTASGTAAKSIVKQLSGPVDLTLVGDPETGIVVPSHAFFQNKNLRSVTFSDCATRIESNAFFQCPNLETVVLPKTVDYIGGAAFYGSGVKNLTMPQTIKEMSGEVFSYCNALETLVVPEGAVTVGGFANCDALKTVSLPSTLKSIQPAAFEYCRALEAITLPEGLESLGRSAFRGSGLKTIAIPAGVAEIPEWAFYECTALTGVQIPGTVKKIGQHAFNGCSSLASLTLGSGVETVIQGAFAKCSFTHVTIPASVKTLDIDSFGDNKNLRSVFFEGDMPPKAYFAFTDPVTIYYPAGNATWKKPSSNWPEGTIWSPVKAHDHDWDAGTVVKAADCSSTGLIRRSCTLCPAVTEEVLPFAHERDIVPGIPAGCTTPGVMDTITCTLCGEVLQSPLPIPALGHDPQTVGNVLPTCTEDGYSGDLKCVNCQEVYEKGSTIPSLGHDHIQETISKKKPTATEFGYSSFQVIACSRCEHWFREDNSVMTAEEMEDLKRAHVLYAAAKSVSITQAVTGAPVPKVVDAGDYPDGLALQAAVSPMTASQKVKWSSSKTSVATVSQTGVVTFLKNGSVTITATGTDRRSAKVSITVKTLADTIDVSAKTGQNTISTLQKLTLKAAATPAAAGSAVTWSLSKEDQAYAKISSSGVLTPKSHADLKTKAVQVTAIATAKDGGGARGEYTVTICPAATSLAFPDGGKGSLDMSRDSGEITLQAQVLPQAASQDLKWTCDNPEIAVITATEGASCTLQIQDVGTATIRAEATDGSGKKKSYTLTVTASVTGLELDPQYQVQGGQSLTLPLRFLPENATNRKVTWTSDRSDLVSITDKGVLTAKNVTEDTMVSVTAASEDGPTARCDVVIRPSAETVTLTSDGTPIEKKPLYLDLDKTLSLGVVIAPEKASQSVTWSTSKSSVASVGPDGTVTPKKTGTATITATATDGSKTRSSVEVKVVRMVQQIKLAEEMTIVAGKKVTLKPGISPSKATEKGYTWSWTELPAGVTFKKGVITVSKDLEARETFGITATSKDGGAVATCKVTVVPLAKKVELTQNGQILEASSLEVTTDDVLTLGALVTPEGESGAEQKVTWSTSNKKIATVTDGKVTFLKPGTVTITATAADGSKKKDSVKFSVVQMVESLSLPGEIAVGAGKERKLTPVLSPSNASNKGYSWDAVELPEGVTFSKGVLKVSKALETQHTFVLTAKSKDGGAAGSCTVTVGPLASSVQVTRKGEQASAGPLTATTDDILELEAAVYAGETRNACQQVTWSTGNKKIATVAEGKVTFLKPGTVTITATAADGSKKQGSVKITVTQRVKEITLPETQFLIPGKTLTQALSVMPANASSKKVQWSMTVLEGNREDLVFDEKTGSLKTIQNPSGNARVLVTATALDGSNVKGESTVLVFANKSVGTVKYLNGQQTTASGLTLRVKETANLQVEFYAAPGEDGEENPDCCQEYRWSSSKPSVASIAADGTVTAKKKGTTTLTATNRDGSGVKATFKLTVK